MKTYPKSNKFRFLSMLLLAAMALSITMGAAQAASWHTANQLTVAWDAVTTKDDGGALGAGETIEYVVYMANAATDPNKANPVEVDRTAATESTLTLNVEGSFFVGVKAVRKLADGTAVSESTISWSDTADATGAGNEFGVRYFLPPGKVKVIRPK